VKSTGRAAAALKRFLRILLIFLVALALGAAGFLLAGSILAPKLTRVDPLILDRGGLLVIEGSRFGKSREGSHIEIGGFAPPVSAYESWDEGRIGVRLPFWMDAGPVCVVTRYGRSNARSFSYRKIPALQPGLSESASPAKNLPIIESVTPERGSIGSLLTITGQNFGASRMGGEVLFPWSASANSEALSDAPDSGYIPGDELGSGYEYWSDREIRVRVPDGAQSGSFFIRTSKGKSNGYYFDLSSSVGRKEYSDRRSYSLGYTVTLKRIRSSGANSLVLWAPRPVNSANQRLVKLVEEDPRPFDPDFRGDAVYRFSNLDQNSQISVKQVFLVQSWAVKTEINPELVHSTAGQTALIRACLAADPFVPSDREAIRNAAQQITQGEQNPYRAARLIYDYLTATVAWAPANAGAGEAQAGRTAQGGADAAVSAQASAQENAQPGAVQGQGGGQVSAEADKNAQGAAASQAAPAQGQTASPGPAAVSGAGSRTALGALETGRADTTAYAFLAAALLRAAQVPAVPVSGFRIGENQRAVKHAWVEFYLSGIGWVPMDPILGSGAAPGGLPAAFEDVSRYFGNIDSQRVAFARGYISIQPLSANSRHASPAAAFGCQPFYEEASGGLDAYSSFWGGLEILGLY